MMHVPYSFDFQCRNEAVVINGLYHQEQIAIAYRKEAYADGKLPVPAYFRFDPVGVENDSLADFYLTSVNNGMLAPMMTRYPSIGGGNGRHEKGRGQGRHGPAQPA